MNIDWVPLKGQLNKMALQLAIILLVSLVVGLAVKFVLIKVKLPYYIANVAAVSILLFTFYKMLLIVLG